MYSISAVAAINRFRFNTTLLVLAFLLPGSQVSGSEAYIDEDRLVIPTVMTRDGAGFGMEMAISDKPNLMGLYPMDSSPIMQTFELLRVESVSSPNSRDAAWFESSNGNLLIPRINVGGTHYWARLFMRNSTPVLFELIDFGVDDLDDDDDGVPDEEDSLPYAPVSEDDPLGIVGLWTFRYEPSVTEIGPYSPASPGTYCPPPETVSFQEYEISYVGWYADESYYIISSGDQSALLGYDGDALLYFSRTYSRDGGTTKGTHQLDLFSPSLMQGFESWNWKGVPGYCNKHSPVTAIKKGR